MRVNIILITYNQEQFVAQAVESILMQRVNDDVQVRVIVADDCSKDKTLEIIKSYEKKSPFAFVYLSAEKNLGISKNYQRAIAACDGDYIAILEGDDWWSCAKHIEQHIRFLKSHPECSMTMNRISYIRPDIVEPVTFGWNYNEDVYYVDTETQITQGNQLGNLSACVIKTNYLKSLDSSLYELYVADWMLGVLLSQKGLIAILKDSTSVYRQNIDSQWAGLTRREQINQLISLAKIYDNYQDGLCHKYWNLYIKKLKREKYNKFYKRILPTSLIKLIKYAIGGLKNQ